MRYTYQVYILTNGSVNVSHYNTMEIEDNGWLYCCNSDDDAIRDEVFYPPHRVDRVECTKHDV